MESVGQYKRVHGGLGEVLFKQESIEAMNELAILLQLQSKQANDSFAWY